MLGKKKRMTQYFDENGSVTPATLLQAGPVVVTQIRTNEKDGYTAVQVGYGTRNRISKALQGHFGGKGSFAVVREFRPKAEGNIAHTDGDTVDVSSFAPGDTVTISGTTKGKGFQGTVKRHGFGGGPRSHGQRHSEREPGSIGATGPQRVMKGTRMAGRMGADRVTLKNITVLAVDPETNEMLVSGAVPGRPGGIVEIKG